MTHIGRTLQMSKTLRCQTRQQYTTLLHQDAYSEEDAANGAPVHNLPLVNASVRPATCVVHDSITVKHVSNGGAIVKPITTTNMHIVSTEVLVVIMNCSQSALQIRMQLMQSPANGIPSPEPQQTQKYLCPLLRIQIKPQQLRWLMISRTCLDFFSAQITDCSSHHLTNFASKTPECDLQFFLF